MCPEYEDVTSKGTYAAEPMHAAGWLACHTKGGSRGVQHIRCFERLNCLARCQVLPTSESSSGRARRQPESFDDIWDAYVTTIAPSDLQSSWSLWARPEEILERSDRLDTRLDDVSPWGAPPLRPEMNGPTASSRLLHASNAVCRRARRARTQREMHAPTIEALGRRPKVADINRRIQYRRRAATSSQAES